jgi:hypothetical protein
MMEEVIPAPSNRTQGSGGRTGGLLGGLLSPTILKAVEVKQEAYREACVMVEGITTPSNRTRCCGGWIGGLP